MPCLKGKMMDYTHENPVPQMTVPRLFLEGIAFTALGAVSIFLICVI
jgi:hypothetical protein